MYCSIVMHGQLLFKKAFIPPPVEVGVFCQNYDKIKKDGSTAISKRVMLMKNKDDKVDFKLLLIVSISVGVLLFIMYVFFRFIIFSHLF